MECEYILRRILKNHRPRRFDSVLLFYLQGIIINGCIRDSEDISQMPLGVKALNTYPLKSSKRDLGLRDVPINFAGCVFKPGYYVYADLDGVLVAPSELKLPSE